ncbi:MAG: hypothetical protein K9I37_08095 [Crocinitomicaceae bacterium]|jgi:hypothetical protein|nr:hypothetical protein [Crocinitomicaceae bacterium]
MARVQYTTYRFNRPSELRKEDYEILKEVLGNNPNHSINPPSSFIETFRGELIFLGAALLGLLILSFDVEILNWIGGIAAFLGFGVLFSFVPSALSYLGFLSEKASFYSRLRKDILRSSDYSEFQNIRNKRR